LLSPEPLLLRGLLLAGHGLAGALAGPRVGVRALPAHGEAPAVPNPLVRTDLDLALDVLGDLAPQVTLDLVGPVDELADLADLVFGEIAHLRAALHPRALDDLVRPGGTDAVDVTEWDVKGLVGREVAPGDPSHAVPPLSLPLLVPGVRADHADHAAPADHLAAIADLLHRRTDLHERRTCG